jgi:hypothetical protein
MPTGRAFSWAGVGIGATWLLAFAGVGLWEFRAAEPFSLRGGQAGLPYPWTALVLVIGGPLALLASLGCTVLALIRHRREPRAAGRLSVSLLGPALVIVGGLAIYVLLGLIAQGKRAERDASPQSVRINAFRGVDHLRDGQVSWLDHARMPPACERSVRAVTDSAR